MSAGRWVTIREGHPLAGHHVYIAGGHVRGFRAVRGGRYATRLHRAALAGRSAALVAPDGATARDLARVTRSRLLDEADDLARERRRARRAEVQAAEREWIRDHHGVASLGAAIRRVGGIGHTATLRHDFDARIPPAFASARGQGIDGVRESLRDFGFRFGDDSALVAAVVHHQEWSARHAGLLAARRFDAEERYSAMERYLRDRAKKRLEKRAYDLENVPF